MRFHGSIGPTKNPPIIATRSNPWCASRRRRPLNVNGVKREREDASTRETSQHAGKDRRQWQSRYLISRCSNFNFQSNFSPSSLAAPLPPTPAHATPPSVTPPTTGEILSPLACCCHLSPRSKGQLTPPFWNLLPAAVVAALAVLPLMFMEVSY